MNFGYLLIVSEHSDIDYLKLAYALALSIKNTQKEGYDKIALVIDNKEKVNDLKSPWVFDTVIEWNKETSWNGRSYMDQLTPWDYSVCLDVDMIFTRDYSHWIDYFLENSELYIANTAYTYRGDLVTDDYYRKTFTKNKLPNLYSFYTFFKKDSSIVKEFFDLNRHIIHNPTKFKNLFLEKFKPEVVGTDEAFALSAKLLDVAESVSYPLEFPRVVHMKPMIQNWPWPADSWADHVGFYMNKQGRVKVGNFYQTDIFHYVKKDIITDEIVSILEEIVWKK
jgi:hypothetical protein